MENEQLQKCHTCVAYHIQAFQRQAVSGEPADMTEPCKHCFYSTDCDYAWYQYISQAIPESNYRFTLANGCAYLPDHKTPGERVAALEIELQRLQSEREAIPRKLREILLAQREEHAHER